MQLPAVPSRRASSLAPTPASQGHISNDPLLGCLQKASKERYVFFSFPHVAVDPNGGLGSIQRPGREACSSACGALKAALGHFQGVGVGGPGQSEPHSLSKPGVWRLLGVCSLVCMGVVHGRELRTHTCVSVLRYGGGFCGSAWLPSVQLAGPPSQGAQIERQTVHKGQWTACILWCTPHWELGGSLPGLSGVADVPPQDLGLRLSSGSEFPLPPGLSDVGACVRL